jgi:hypothetical protein
MDRLAHSPGDLAALEAALLARGARKVGRHWRVRCPFLDHPDQHPSCDYDPIKHVFYCRGCHRGGGWRLLAELLGLAPAWSPRPPPVSRDRPLAGSADVLAELRRWLDRWAVRAERNAVADHIRAARQWVAAVRRWASTQGDRDEVWRVLASAADVETLASSLDTWLDEEERREWMSRRPKTI